VSLHNLKVTARCTTVIFSQMQGKVLLFKFGVWIWGHLQFLHEALNWTMPKCIALNQTIWSQTQACINKSCEVCTLLRYYAAMSGNSMLAFRNNLSFPPSRIKKHERENRAHGKLTDTIFVWLCPSSNFLKAHNLLAVGSVSGLKQPPPDMVDPLDWVILNHWATQKQ